MAAYSASNNFWSFVIQAKDFGGHFTDTSPDFNVRDSSFFQCRLAGGMRGIQPRASTFCALVAKDPRSDTVADVELVEGIDTTDGTNVPCGLSGDAAGTATEDGETLTGLTGGLPNAVGLSSFNFFFTGEVAKMGARSSGGGEPSSMSDSAKISNSGVTALVFFIALSTVTIYVSSTPMTPRNGLTLASTKILPG